MIEIVAAVAIPVGVTGLIGWRAGGDFRRAVLRWFIPMALIWFAPCWMTGRSPAPFDYLAADVWPWKQAGFVAGNPLLSDATLQFLPWRESVREAVASGSFPFLDRSAGSGSPLWENLQAAAAWPLTWIGLPLSTFAWPLFAAVTKLLVALCCMYLFLRRRTASHAAAIAGAVAYGFCAFNVAFALFPHTDVTAFLPALLLAIESMSTVWMAVVVALMLTGGHPESVLHCSFVAVPYAIAVMMRRRAILPVVAGSIAGLMLAAPVLIPFATFLPLSERVARIARHPDIIATPPATLANLAAFFSAEHLAATRDPNPLKNFNEVASQYAGLVTFGLALAAALFDARRQRFWIAVFLAAAFFSFDSPIARAITSRIPVVDLTVQGRLRFVVAFAVAVLAARGVDLIGDRSRRPHAALVVGIVALAAAPLAGIVAAAAGLAIALTRRAVLVPLAIFADLASVLILYNPPVARTFFYPTTPALAFMAGKGGRIATIENALRPETAAMRGLEDIGFHNPMAFEAYGALLDRAGYDRRMYFNVFHRIPPKPVLDFLGVRYVVAPPSFSAPDLPVAYRGADATIFENRGASGRVIPMSPGATAAVEGYGAGGERIIVRATAAARIATSEVALPGWRLTREGKPWPMVRLRGAFIGFEVPTGESRLELRYEPVGFRLGVVLAAVGIALLVALSRRWRPASASSPAEGAVAAPE